MDNALLDMGQKARTAAKALSQASTAQKNQALLAMAHHIRNQADTILKANELDLAAAHEKNMKAAFVDRLTLTKPRIEAMAKGLEDVAKLADPVGRVTAKWLRPNGMEISRIAVPIGVIGIIYESRPNVTADAGALCLKSGNTAILRGGSDSFHSSSAIVACLQAALRETGLDPNCIQMVPSTNREIVGHMLTGLDSAIDLIVPRGGKTLVARVQAEARVPVFSHLEGICHVYVDKDADLAMAKSIVLNAKMRRTGICGAAETVLVDEAASENLQPIVKMLLDAGCEVRGDAATKATDPRVKTATEEDWSTEYEDAIISIKLVDGVKSAIAHIAKYGSQHTDSIVTANVAIAEKFLNEVDSAIVLHNASTQFADGGEFGFGAEIGIATGKLHARGPVGVEQLTTFKYQIRGAGQIRP